MQAPPRTSASGAPGPGGPDRGTWGTGPTTAGIDLQQLEVFVVVVELRSVSGAARALYLAQSAVTRRLQRLERSVGRDLLERTSRGTRPTPAGQYLYGQARALLAAVDVLREDVASFGGPSTGGHAVPA